MSKRSKQQDQCLLPPGDPAQALGLIFRLMSIRTGMTPSMYRQVVAPVRKIKDWLGSKDAGLARYKPEVFPQGSLSIGLMVRPLAGHHFDADLVCLLNNPPRSISAADLKGLLGEALARNPTFSRRLEEKNRCWRIRCGDLVHVDVLPAGRRPSSASNVIFVPDSSLGGYKLSNPVGFLDFYRNVRGLSTEGWLERIAPHYRDPPPSWIAGHPMQAAIGLLKRFRDVHYNSPSARSVRSHDLAPISIAITAAASIAYAVDRNIAPLVPNGPLVARTPPDQRDVFELMRCLLDQMPYWIARPTDGQPCIPNMRCPNENFAERWTAKPRFVPAFQAWCRAGQRHLNRLLRTFGSREFSPALDAFVGEPLAKLLLPEYRELCPRWPSPTGR